MPTDTQVISKIKAFELSQTDRLALVGLASHPGFKVLNHMMIVACEQANAKVIKCDPVARDRVLTLQLEARAANEFCSLLGAAINYHSKCVNAVKPDEVKPEVKPKVRALVPRPAPTA